MKAPNILVELNDLESQAMPLILAGSLRSLVIAGHEIQLAIPLLGLKGAPHRDPLRYGLLEAGWQLGALAEVLGGDPAVPDESKARKARQALRALQGITQQLTPLLQAALQSTVIDAKADLGTPSPQAIGADCDLTSS